MLDEMSLGLAPVIVDRLLPAVGRPRSATEPGCCWWSSTCTWR